MQNLYEELNATDPKVRKTVADGESLISKSKDASANHIKQNVELLQQRWKNIQMRAADKKVRKSTGYMYLVSQMDCILSQFFRHVFLIKLNS